MKIKIDIAKEDIAGVVDAIKRESDMQHRAAQRLSEYITIEAGCKPNETQKAVLCQAAKQRRVADALRGLASAIERA